MNNLKRFLLGALSSLLFATGFVRAAGQLDPVSRSLPKTSDPTMAGAPDCVGFCDSSDSNT
jgi:hypothetical protein